MVAHPSHELRIHGWLQLARPHVYVFTDGSGRAGGPRLQSTTKVLEDVGAKRGSVYGRCTDTQVYDALLKKDFSFFIDIADELAEEFIRNEIEYVVGDADEGYTPAHEVCRLLTNAAVEISGRRSKRQIANFEFAVVGSPEECPAAVRDQAIWVHLDDEAFSRKISAARDFNSKLALDIEAALRGEPFKGAGHFSEPELAAEVDKDLTTKTPAALPAHPDLERESKDVFDGIELGRFRVECLRPVAKPAANTAEANKSPFYELYGDKMVAAGHYQTTIRYAEHFLPLAEAVWRHVSAVGDQKSEVRGQKSEVRDQK